MSKNRVFAGNEPAVALPVPAGITSGDPVIVGGIHGVAATDRAAVDSNGVHTGGVTLPAGYASVEVSGAFEVTVTGAIASAGGRVYINPADNTLTATAAAGLVLFGTTVPVVVRGVATGATKGAAAGPVNVKLAPPSLPIPA